MIIIGIEHSAGIYQNVPYDNIKFHCFSDEIPKSLKVGNATEVLKVKTSMVLDVLGLRSVDSIDFNALCGGEVIPTYGKNSVVTSLSFSLASAPDDSSSSPDKAKDENKTPKKS